jgi:hypothetical protein
LSFYFRGPDDKLKLRAQNLAVFVQLAEGVDDETWLFHLRQVISPIGFAMSSRIRNWLPKPSGLSAIQMSALKKAAIRYARKSKSDTFWSRRVRPAAIQGKFS